jgi:hypothetical protein
MDKSNCSWIAWYVYYEPPCDGRETIGYFQTELDAEMARANFAKEKGLKETGLCCSNSEYVYKEKIEIS